MKIANSGYDYRHSADFGITRKEGSGDYMLLLVRSRARFYLDGKEQYVSENAAILYRKGTPQVYAAAGEEFINDWIHFEVSGQEAEWLHGLGIPFDTLIFCSRISELSALLKSICREKYSANRNAEEAAELYLRLLLLKLADLCAAQGQGEHSLWLERFSKIRERVYMYPQRDWSVGEIARELSVSISYFQHQYKRLFGTNFKRDLTAARLEYAKYLLFSTGYCIYRVAELCGYENDVHFMRVFKEHVGLTPSDYRKQSNFSEEKSVAAHSRMPFSEPQ